MSAEEQTASRGEGLEVVSELETTEHLQENTDDVYANLTDKMLARWPLEQWQEDVVLLAVSGGADSMALLKLVVDQAPNLDRIKVVHVNHGLRGAESDADEDFVLEQCIEYGVECLSVRLSPVSGFLSSEESLRNLRYDAFEETGKAVQARWIVLAHHLDDNIETFFIRLLRGTGLRGLEGIPFQREVSPSLPDCKYVRPLLDTSREAILSWLEQTGIPYREDSSNATDAYLRNRIRHQLMPTIDGLSTQDWREKVSALMDEIGTRNHAIRDEVLTILHSGALDSSTPGTVQFPLYLFRDVRWEVFREFLVEIWLRENWPQQQLSRKHWRLIQCTLGDALATPHPKSIHLPGKVRMEVRQKIVRISRTPQIDRG